MSQTTEPGATYTLVRPERAVESVPVLDEAQQAVVDHPGGPLLVLAGPGTGKTTTMVEAIVEVIDRRGVPAEQVLALTFSRKAAEQLRDRITARLGGASATTLSSTFHSFAYGLVRAHAPADLYQTPLHLLSAAEQDVVLAELLTDSPEAVRWPDSMRRAVGTRGFAREVAQVLSRAREKGLEPEDLHRLGIAEQIPEYAAAGLFLGQYLDTLDSLGAIDYPDLIRRAVIEAEAHRDELRTRFTHVFVDEYQDTDPGQVALLRALAGDGGNLTVVGDPHQSIYGFRGADLRGILDFPAEFRRRDGSPAPVVALRTTRRFGPRLLLAAQRVASRLSLTGSIDAEARAAFLDPVAATDGRPDGHQGRVEVITFDTERAEAEHIADILRRAHLTDKIDWSQMAVLVRSGRATIPGLRRSLIAAGVPVEVASDETPLVREPAVRPLLEALAAVVDLEIDDPDHTGYIDTARAHALLVSPLAGLDATEVRALSRLLRTRERQRATAEGRSPRSSAELLREAVLDSDALADLEGLGVERARALARLLRAAREQMEARCTAEEVLWSLWAGTGWPQRLRSAAELGGNTARLAHRDLDAICALFETAARAEDQVGGHRSVQAFLDTLAAQEIPADTLADRGVGPDAVRLLTAHRSKGLEWRLVVVAHVQEEGWPDLRRRATLLQADRIGRLVGGVPQLQPPVSLREALQEERRLFYVACTRARQRLVVTAVASPEDDGEQPSRFLAELLPDGREPEHVSGRPVRPLSLPGLVAELRRTVADPDSPPGLRAAAARRLARLARERTSWGVPLVPTADPANWWGTRAATRAEVPLRAPDEPLTLSASTLTSLLTCPAQWFLEREAGGATAVSSAQGFGLIVHALADRIARGELPEDPARVEELMEHVDAVWGQLTFRTPWSGTREREEIRAALRRFLLWHGRPGARVLVAGEQPIRCQVELPDGQRIGLYGFADRIEIDDDGRVVVVDLKTGKYPPTRDEVAEHPQLGLYQYAVAHGAVDNAVAGHLTGPAQPGGAELVHLRKESRGEVTVQRQGPPEPDADGRLLIEQQLMHAAAMLRAEDFPARSGKHCEHCAFQTICPIKGAGTVLS